MCKVAEQWTLCVHTKGEGEPQTASLIEHGRTAIKIFSEQDKLLFSVRIYGRDEPLLLRVTRTRKPQELKLAWLGHRIELWDKDFLADEEWPDGDCFRSREVTVQYPQNAEPFCSIVFDLQGPECAPPQIANAQYWLPQAGECYVGDCMPFADNGVYHLYYLKDRHGHKSKWGKGAHQFAHISTSDFVNWTNHPNAVEITHQWEGSICTGSIIRDKDTYYAFYAVRMMDETSAKLSWATSADGITFQKSEKYFTLTAPYESTSARDPEVFADEQGLYHMLVTTNLENSPTPQRSGCLAHLTSRNLVEWEQQEPFLVPGYTDQPECCNYFKWGNWYYLIFSNYGTAKYRYSDSPFGPWIRPKNEIVDGLLFRVPKTAAFGDNRRIAAGFLCMHPEGESYAGNLAFRELIQNADGTLGTGFVPELSPAASEDKTSLALSSDTMYSYKQEQVKSLLRHDYVEITIVPQVGNGCYGLTLTAAGCPGYEIRIQPSEGSLGIYPLHSNLYFTPSKRTLHGMDNLYGKIAIKLVRHDDIIDLCVNDSRTLLSRLAGWQDAEKCQIGGFVMDGGADFTVGTCPTLCALPRI